MVKEVIKTSIRGLDESYQPHAATFGIPKQNFTSALSASEIQTLYDAVKTSPEVVACLSAIVEDIMSDGWKYWGKPENIEKAENFRTNFRSYSNNLNIDFDLTVLEKDLPQEPEKEYEVIHQHSYRESKKEISNAIRLLKMTDEEVVSTSTYNAIAQYL